jgi:hypothetical protein
LRHLFPALLAAFSLTVSPPVGAQESAPAALAAVERERTRTCVGALTELEALDVELAPLAARAQRLLAIAGAINIEEAAIVDSLDVTDPLEAAVADWFRSDAELARRYLAGQSQAILDERSAARSTIQERVAAAIQEVQARADSVVTPTGNLRTRAASCAGSILIRPEAMAACEGNDSRVCQAARDSSSTEPFQFAPSAEVLWNRQELRPWSAPAPLQVVQDGTLGGARTVGNTRVGNHVVSVSFNPVLRSRSELTAQETAAFDSVNGPLGIESTHPEVTFAPALAFQAALPQPLAGETHYLLHFDSPEAPDLLWTGEAGTGAPIVGTVVLAPQHVARLLAGNPIMLTAVREATDGAAEALYAIELSSVNQVSRVRALLGYMSQQLSADLGRLIAPGEAESLDGTAQPPPAADPAPQGTAGPR